MMRKHNCLRGLSNMDETSGDEQNYFQMIRQRQTGILNDKARMRSKMVPHKIVLSNKINACSDMVKSKIVKALGQCRFHKHDLLRDVGDFTVHHDKRIYRCIFRIDYGTRESPWAYTSTPWELKSTLRTIHVMLRSDD